MRIAAAVLFVAVVCLTAQSLAWLRATGARAESPSDAVLSALVADFERAHRPEVDLAIGAQYAGRMELLDPRQALPMWHQYPRDEVVSVHVATKQCPPPPVAALTDAAVAKAYAWHARTCRAGTSPPPDDLVEATPFLHPSGRSYAALAVARGGASHSWIAAHPHAFHVLELASLDPAALGHDDRALAALPAAAWEALTRGQGLFLSRDTLVVAEHGAIGLFRVRLHSREAWDRFGREHSLTLVPRTPSQLCARPASAELCWETMTPVERHRGALVFGTSVSAVLVVLSALFLGVAYLGERRRVHRDRIHVLRTLTHELRTPATTLRLDIEPLRAAYDELPVGCQEPLLRISDGIERLHRVLHRSARYMALFEPSAAPLERLVKRRTIESAKAMFEELAGEWPEDVVLTAMSPDGRLRTDPEWLGVAVRNLVENATRHGKAPVQVSWWIDGGDLRIRVADAGTTPSFSLRRAIVPYERDAGSPGLGLGLAIVDRVASLLGGRLTHEGSPTVFELRLPARGDLS